MRHMAEPYQNPLHCIIQMQKLGFSRLALSPQQLLLFSLVCTVVRTSISEFVLSIGAWLSTHEPSLAAALKTGDVTNEAFFIITDLFFFSESKQ